MNLHIDGMTCAACVRHVRAALEKLPGARVEEVVVGRATLTGVEAAAAAEAVSRAGYVVRETTA